MIFKERKKEDSHSHLQVIRQNKNKEIAQENKTKQKSK